MWPFLFAAANWFPPEETALSKRRQKEFTFPRAKRRLVRTIGKRLPPRSENISTIGHIAGLAPRCLMKRIAETVGDTVLNAPHFELQPCPPLRGPRGWVAERRSCRLGILEIRRRPERWRSRLERNPASATVSPLWGVFAGANSGAKKRFLWRPYHRLFHKRKRWG